LEYRALAAEILGSAPSVEPARGGPERRGMQKDLSVLFGPMRSFAPGASESRDRMEKPAASRMGPQAGAADGQTHEDPGAAVGSAVECDLNLDGSLLPEETTPSTT
jgi:hypothetical protein